MNGVEGLGSALAEVVKKAANVVTNVAKVVTGGATKTTTTPTTLTVTASSLNIRATASTKAAKVTAAPKGAKVTVVDATEITADGYKWIKVQYGGKTGYAAKAYLTTSGTTTNNGGGTTNVNKKGTTTTTTTDTTEEKKTTEEINQQDKKMFTLSDNAKKYIKWGVIGAAVIGAGYFAYTKLGKKSSSEGSLSGIGRKRRKHSAQKVKKMMLP